MLFFRSNVTTNAKYDAEDILLISDEKRIERKAPDGEQQTDKFALINYLSS